MFVLFCQILFGWFNRATSNKYSVEYLLNSGNLYFEGNNVEVKAEPNGNEERTKYTVDPSEVVEMSNMHITEDNPFPQTAMEQTDTQPERTATDGVLRKFSLKNAKALLRKRGVPEQEVTI